MLRPAQDSFAAALQDPSTPAGRPKEARPVTTTTSPFESRNASSSLRGETLAVRRSMISCDPPARNTQAARPTVCLNGLMARAGRRINGLLQRREYELRRPIVGRVPQEDGGCTVVAPPPLGTLAKARWPRQIVNCGDSASFLRMSNVSAGRVAAALAYWQ